MLIYQSAKPRALKLFFIKTSRLGIIDEQSSSHFNRKSGKSRNWNWSAGWKKAINLFFLGKRNSVGWKYFQSWKTKKLLALMTCSKIVFYVCSWIPATALLHGVCMFCECICSLQALLLHPTPSSYPVKIHV